VGIVVAGFLGIAVAYLVMSRISPGNFDYLNVWGRAKPPAAESPKGPNDPDNPWADLPPPGSAKPPKR
jgi:hypothetical protein